ncbi:hypothetical protein CERZMDRAFT_102992 [Cercospora zeae-maydis SCOH1-5]|uniref:Uncharacterized protein n=1 Tax=Cercospora zeae-maydis SCOH1-5 TaxID=717836 RepID=A0A6A6F0G4_9PEZI|nr:hypothetical protein CERZMDRAFT_102992 [Cercospora zeae-maydis SCOH1-5]
MAADACYIIRCLLRLLRGALDTFVFAGGVPSGSHGHGEGTIANRGQTLVALVASEAACVDCLQEEVEVRDVVFEHGENKGLGLKHFGWERHLRSEFLEWKSARGNTK